MSVTVKKTFFFTVKPGLGAERCFVAAEGGPGVPREGVPGELKLKSA